MAKRFTDTEIWSDPWFRKLPMESKVFWKFLTDNCDNAGFWKKDFDLASFLIGMPISGAETPLKTINEGKERVRDHGEYLEVLDFVLFQFGELKETNNFHRSILALQERHRSKKNKETRGVDTPHEGPRNGKGMEKEYRGIVRGKVPPSVSEVRAYCLERKNGIDPEAFVDFYASKGWKVGGQAMKDWQAAVRTWESRRKENGKAPERITCVSCRKDATGNFVQTSGGKVCNECFSAAGKPNKRLSDMKGRSGVKSF